MKTKYIITTVCLLVIATGTGVYFFRSRAPTDEGNFQKTTTTMVKFITSTILSDGIVTAQNQAKLSFQSPGKLSYLPFKEGDRIREGQTIAQLDTYALQKQLQILANSYQTARNGNDQVMENNQAAIIEGQQRIALDTTNKNTYSDITEAQVITDTVNRIVANSLLTKNSAQLSMDIANYALQLSRLTSPLTGIVLHEDVSVPGVNITPATTFTVADPDSMVFRANVPAQSIYYISEGATVSLAIDGIPNKLEGRVVKIYPSKVTLPSGGSVYQVDIQSTDLVKSGKLDEAGTALISTNAQNVALVPAWTVLSGKYIWVDDNGKPVLKQVTAGKIHGNEIEITGGLSPSDQVITDPKIIPSRLYQML